MTRIIAILSLLMFALTAPAFAGGKEDPCSSPGYKDGVCPPNQGHLPGHPGHPGNPGHGHPGWGGNLGGFCAGGYEGLYANGFPVAFWIQQVGYQLQVQAWYGGRVFFGTGLCSPINAWQASFELYFPGSPIHRGLVSSNGYGTVMQGQLDFHYGFQLHRTR